VHQREISELLAAFLESPLVSHQLDQVSAYLDLLLRWNSHINLTAIRAPEEIICRHFGESFFLARHLFPAGQASLYDLSQTPVSLTTDHWPQATVLDIGSGAGFPALPLKIFQPQIRLTLIESNHKKSVFLRETIRSLSLPDVNVITDRAENVRAANDLAENDRAENQAVYSENIVEPGAAHQADRKHRIDYAFVTFRAVEKFDTILPLARSFLSQNGTLGLLIGASQLQSLRSLSGISWDAPIYVPKSQQRIVVLGHRLTTEMHAN
jgi:16S rRNA (guanine(527)-N(7))-methyltransferase RsmG